MSEQKEFNTYLSVINQTYFPLIEKQLENSDITFDEYSKQCVLNAIASINNVLDKAGIKWGDASLDQSNITQTLLNIAHLKLNTVAEPSECYFQLRNMKSGLKDANGKDVWKKVIEMGIQGDGYDAILARFGRNVKMVYPYWVVRSGDKFQYPRYQGVEMTPPVWEPSGQGEVERIVYPILFNNNTIHYYIGEKSEVTKNLLAHINNNMMNETFGIVKDRYNATPEQLKKINARKAELKTKAKAKGLDALDDAELSPYISPSWKEDFSRESMIIRKIRNNIVKKIPKDFGSSIARDSYSELSDDSYRNVKNVIEAETATIPVTIEAEADEVIVDNKTGEVLADSREVENKENIRQTEPNPSQIENRVKPNFN